MKIKNKKYHIIILGKGPTISINLNANYLRYMSKHLSPIYQKLPPAIENLSLLIGQNYLSSWSFSLVDHKPCCGTRIWSVEARDRYAL